MAFPRVFSLSMAVLGSAYLVGYVLLDWVSFIHPIAPYGITPWNPSTGLSFVLVLLFGQRFVPFLFVAPLLADLVVRRLPLPWPMEIVSIVIIGAGYSVALLFLMRPGTRFDPTLASMRNLLLLLLVAAASTVAVAAVYVCALVLAGLLPPASFLAAALRFWIGDMIGIAVVTPFALMILTRGRFPRPSAETAAQGVAILAALVLVFGYAESLHFQLFYLLFLPIVWIAVRSGLEGVTLGILVTQIGLIIGVQLLPLESIDVTAFQALMLVLALTGLIAGALVTEHRRTEIQLRLHQDSLARLARLGSMGELAAAVAHEINQPLMAAGTYSRLVVDQLRLDGHEDQGVVETAGKAASQVERAAEVVRRLRALIRLDQSGRAPTSLQRIVQETLELYRPNLERYNVKVRVTLDEQLPQVMVDLLQIEQVLLNLLRNAIEALSEADRQDGAITIEASLNDAGVVEMRLRDNGPGFPNGAALDQIPPLSSAKPEGLGVGLSLCRSIVEAHGGRMWLSGAAPGAVVHFTLPSATADA